jgi:hypothetical protein
VCPVAIRGQSYMDGLQRQYADARRMRMREQWKESGQMLVDVNFPLQLLLYYFVQETPNGARV